MWKMGKFKRGKRGVWNEGKKRGLLSTVKKNKRSSLKYRKRVKFRKRYVF